LYSRDVTPPARAEAAEDLLQDLTRGVPYPKARAFLQAYRKHRKIGKAAEAVGISTSIVRYWRGAGGRTLLRRLG